MEGQWNGIVAVSVLYSAEASVSELIRTAGQRGLTGWLGRRRGYQ